MLSLLTECDEGAPEEMTGLAALLECKLRVSDAVSAVNVWLMDGFERLASAITAPMSYVSTALQSLFVAPPNTGWLLGLPATEIAFLYPTSWHPLVLTVLCTLATFWCQRSWRSAAIVLIALLFILNQGYWQAAAQSLSLALTVSLFAVAFGVTLGAASASLPWLHTILRPALAVGNGVPVVVNVALAVLFFGVGMTAGLLATFLFVLPRSIARTHAGLAATPPDMLQTAVAFGARPSQAFFKIKLPHGWPQIKQGIAQTVMLSFTMVVSAMLFSTGGPGALGFWSINPGDIGESVEVILVITAIAVLVARLFGAHAK